MTPTKLCLSAICAFGLLGFGISYGAGLNGPNPKAGSIIADIGGASNRGAAQLGGSFLANGTILTGFGVATNAVVLGTGAYELDFNRVNLAGCVWTGSIGFGTFGGNS